jgi:hypothetical protein
VVLLSALQVVLFLVQLSVTVADRQGEGQD